MELRAFREIDWQLLFIRSYTLLSFYWNIVSNQTVKTVKFLTNSFQKDLYCFYAGSDVPVRVNDYAKDVAGASTVEFYYDRDSKVLTKTRETVHIPRLLDVESARLYHGDILLYDLTDFFDSTRFAGSVEVPSLNRWIATWELEAGIFLDRTKEFTVEIEFLGGGVEKFSLWNGPTARWNERVSRVPRLHRQSFQPPAVFSSTCSCPPTAPSTGVSNAAPEPLSASDLSGNAVQDLSGNLVVEEEVDQGEVAEETKVTEEENLE